MILEFSDDLKYVTKMNLKTILGKNVKYYRYRKKYTQEQLAEILDVSTNYIGRLERGQHSPSLEK